MSTSKVFHSPQYIIFSNCHTFGSLTLCLRDLKGKSSIVSFINPKYISLASMSKISASSHAFIKASRHNCFKDLAGMR